MGLWVESITAGGVTLTDLLIKEKATVFAHTRMIWSFPMGGWISLKNATIFKDIVPMERGEMHL